MVRVLGPIQIVRADGSVAPLGSATQRRLLALLALASPRMIRTERLGEVLGLSPSALRTSVSRLRRAVGDALVTTTAGYRLDVPVDATLRCRELGNAGTDPEVLAAVLSRWGGPAVEEFATEPWAVGEARRLDEIRANALEDQAEALIDRRRSGEAVALLDAHVAAHPLRDRAWGLLIRALGASGRQTDALRAFQRYRDLLAEEYGTEPSHEVRSIERRVAAGWGGTAANVVRQDAATPCRTHLPPGPPDGIPVVGRATEIALLAREFDAARTSCSLRVVTIVGEAGIGKSTLLGAFARARADAATVLYGGCDEGVAVPLQPFRSVIGALVECLPNEVLAAHANAHGGVLTRLAPPLARRVDVREPIAADDATARFVLGEAAVDLLARAAVATPLVLLLDDLHWADATALQLLRHLVRDLAESTVLLVVSLRSVGVEPSAEMRTALAELGRVAGQRIDLRGLDADGIESLVRLALAQRSETTEAPKIARADTADVAAQLARESAGNPLFATQLLRAWTAEGRDPDVEASVPPTLREVILQRVDALGPAARGVLTAGAVLGQEFSEHLLTDVVDLPELTIDDAIEAATRAGLLYRVGPATVRFVHGLVATAIAAEARGAERRRLHERSAHALLKEEELLGPARPAQVAHHFTEAALHADALRWATAAGDDALDHHAPAEAIDWYERALALADRLSRPPDERADLVVRRGEAEVRAGRPEGLATLLEGARLARQSDAAAPLARAAFASEAGFARIGAFALDQLQLVEWALEAEPDPAPADHARLLALLGQCLVHTNQAERRLKAASQALEIARASSDRTLLARISPAALHALWVPGSARMRMQLATEAIEAAERAGDPYLTFMVHTSAYNAAVSSADAGAAARSDARRRALLGIVGDRGRWSIGISDVFTRTMAARFAEAEELANETYTLGERIGEPVAFEVFASELYAIRTFQGRHAELLPFIEPIVAAGTVPLPFKLGYGILCAATGRDDVARRMLDEGRESEFAQVLPDVLWMTAIIGYAVLATELHDVDAAQMLYPLVLPYASEVAFNGSQSQGPVAAYLGKLASMLGDHDAAEHHLRTALDIADAFGWTYHRATTLYALAEDAHRRSGRIDAPTSAGLDEAIAICRTFDIGLWGERANRLRATA